MKNKGRNILILLEIVVGVLFFIRWSQGELDIFGIVRVLIVLLTHLVVFITIFIFELCKRYKK